MDHTVLAFWTVEVSCCHFFYDTESLVLLSSANAFKVILESVSEVALSSFDFLVSQDNIYNV